MNITGGMIQWESSEKNVKREVAQVYYLLLNIRPSRLSAVYKGVAYSPTSHGGETWTWGIRK